MVWLWQIGYSCWALTQRTHWPFCSTKALFQKQVSKTGSTVGGTSNSSLLAIFHKRRFYPLRQQVRQVRVQVRQAQHSVMAHRETTLAAHLWRTRVWCLHHGHFNLSDESSPPTQFLLSAGVNPVWTRRIGSDLSHNVLRTYSIVRWVLYSKISKQGPAAGACKWGKIWGC